MRSFSYIRLFVGILIAGGLVAVALHVYYLADAKRKYAKFRASANFNYAVVAVAKEEEAMNWQNDFPAMPSNKMVKKRSYSEIGYTSVLSSLGVRPDVEGMVALSTFQVPDFDYLNTKADKHNIEMGTAKAELAKAGDTIEVFRGSSGMSAARVLSRGRQVILWTMENGVAYEYEPGWLRPAP